MSIAVEPAIHWRRGALMSQVLRDIIYELIHSS
jgi:hypothetical protein